MSEARCVVGSMPPVSFGVVHLCLFTRAIDEGTKGYHHMILPALSFINCRIYNRIAHTTEALASSPTSKLRVQIPSFAFQVLLHMLFSFLMHEIFS